MAEPAVDYAAVFQALPGAVALVTPQLIFADANAEFLRLRGLPASCWSVASCPMTAPRRTPPSLSCSEFWPHCAGLRTPVSAAS